MVNRSNFPKNTDAVLGGQSPPPRDSATLGGMEGLRQRFPVGNCEQKVEMLPTALNYGEAGVEFLIEILNDPELTVRATAYQLLKNIDCGRTQQIKASKNNRLFKRDIVQQAVTKGLLLREGDIVYSVYLSAVDYNDEYYTVLDSMQAIERHDFCYDDTFQFFSRYILQEKANRVSASLHEVLFSQGDFKDFCKKQNLKSHKFSLDFLRGLEEFKRDFDCAVQNWMIERNIEIPIDIGEDMENWEIQEHIFQYLQECNNYKLLDELRECVGVGKFSFVHPETITSQKYIHSLENF